MVSGVPSDEGGIVILPDGDDLSTTDQDLGRFYLTADQDRSISAGDTITVTIRADRFDSLDDGALAACGVEFTELEKSIQVDAAMIPRLITAPSEQVNSDNLSVFAQSQIELVRSGLMEDWSGIVHGDGNYACYDQAIVLGPTALGGHIICTDKNSNSYTLWLVYDTQVTDSELQEPVHVYTALQVEKPVIYQDESNTLGSVGSIRAGYGVGPEFIYDQWWYQETDAVVIGV